MGTDIMKALKITILFIACMSAIIFSRIYGPISQLPSYFVVDDNYISLLYKQYIFMAVTCSLVTITLGYALKVKLFPATLVMFLAGTSFVALTSMGNPGNLERFLGSLQEFLVPFMSIWAILVTVVVSARYLFIKWPKNS